MARESVTLRGYRVPGGDFTGTVHSVFASTCNLAVNGLLVTLQEAARPMTPAGLGICQPGGWRPRVKRGERVLCRSGILYAGAHLLEIDEAPVWTLPPTPPAALPEARLRALGTLRRAHGEARFPADIQAIAARLHALCALFQASDHLPEPSILSAHLHGLIGAGPGLTPSGDDMLVGLLAALHRGGEGTPRAATIFDVVGSAVREQCHRTTDISAHYLALAADGDFSAPLAALVDAARAGQGADALQPHLHELLSIGASSGADALCGLIAGLALCLDQPAAAQGVIARGRPEPFINEDMV